MGINGYPQAHIPGVGVVIVRRYIFTTLLGRTVPSRKWCIVNTCGNRLCVAPGHVGMRSRSSVMSKAYKDGSRNVIAEVVQRRKARKASGLRMMTDEQIAYVRAQDGNRSTLSIANEIGFHWKSVAKVRKGLTHRTTANGASVFGWRP